MPDFVGDEILVQREAILRDDRGEHGRSFFLSLDDVLSPFSIRKRLVKSMKTAAPAFTSSMVLKFSPAASTAAVVAETQRGRSTKKRRL